MSSDRELRLYWLVNSNLADRVARLRNAVRAYMLPKMAAYQRLVVDSRAWVLAANIKEKVDMDLRENSLGGSNDTAAGI
jgi:hypothetical protein